MNKLLGGHIKALRTAKDYTQEQAADCLVESGIDNITLETLEKTAEMLDVTVGDITGVLDEVPAAAYPAGVKKDSSGKIFDMLDFFYANKHMYTRLRCQNR